MRHHKPALVIHNGPLGEQISRELGREYGEFDELDLNLDLGSRKPAEDLAAAALRRIRARGHLGDRVVVILLPRKYAIMGVVIAALFRELDPQPSIGAIDSERRLELMDVEVAASRLRAAS